MRLLKAQNTNLRNIKGNGVKYDVDDQVIMDSTNTLLIPKGTEAERPVNPTEGHLRYNTDDNEFEAYQDGAWREVGFKEPFRDPGIVTQYLGDGDTASSKVLFGPLNSGDTDYPDPASSQSIMVYVENVYQIPGPLLDGNSVEIHNYVLTQQSSPGSISLSSVLTSPVAPGTVWGVYADESYLYVAVEGTPTLTVYDVDTFTTEFTYSDTSPFRGNAVISDANYIYFGDSDGGDHFKVFDKTDFSIVPGTPTFSRPVTALADDANFVYIGQNQSPYLTVMDKTDFSVVQTLPGISVGTEINTLHVDDTYIYAGGPGVSSEYLSIIDKNSYTIQTGIPQPPGEVNGITSDDTYVYVGHRDAPYLTVLDKTDFTTVTGPTLTDNINDVGDDENYLYLAVNGSFGANEGLAIVDKSDFSVVSGTPTDFDFGNEIYVDSNRLYIGYFSTPYLSIYNKTVTEPGVGTFVEFESPPDDGKPVIAIHNFDK